MTANDKPEILAEPVSLRQKVLEYFPSELRTAGTIVELAERVHAIGVAKTLASRLDALVTLIQWSRDTGLDPGGAPDRSRLLLLVQVVEGVAEVRRRLQDTFADILSETEGVNLFGDTGIPGDRGFLAELVDRVMARLLPQPSDEHDLSRLIARLYGDDDAVERLGTLAPETFHRIVELLAPAERPEIWAPLKAAFIDGFRLLAVRVEAQGLSDKLRMRSRQTAVANSPFYRLARASHALMDACKAGADPAQLIQAWHRDCTACREEMAEITRRLEGEGVSVAIVYGLEILERCLARMEAMLAFIEAPPGVERTEAVHRLMVSLIGAAHEDRSVRHLIRGNLQLLQRKIVERSSKTGEHYVARNLREYRGICLAAAGGGLLTVLTAAVKLKVTHSGMPLFVEGLLVGLNYAVSFMLLHHLHLVLATKQPAMTAAALATLLRSRDRTARLDGVVEFTVLIVRSQLAAAVANVLLVFLGAFAFNFLWQMILGRNYLGEAEARAVFQTLSPVNSGTVFYAALTGVILWMAAMIGGWLDNWAVYNRLPQAIADHKLGTRIGRRRMARFAGAVSRNMAAWGTNISLGFLLGLAPVFGLFFGLPLDVRHVTLSSGMLAFGCAALDGWFSQGWFFWALGGVATMFVLNLSVSFGLSLYTAARAYDLPRREIVLLGGRLLQRFARRPLDFVLPQGEKSRDEKGRDEVRP
jgi:site-specific recombinase